MALISILRHHTLFDSLRNRHFRWFWLGRLATSATMQMGSVAQGWLAYQLTGSALALAGVTAARSAARLIFSLWGGALADRLEKRQLLISTRAAMIVNALTIAVLISTGNIRVWHLVVYSFLSGVISSLMMPAQKAFLAYLVGPKLLLNALSVTSVGRGLLGIFGASLAGLAIDWIGVQSIYFCVAAFYVLALYSLTRLPLAGISSSGTASVWSDLREGLQYLKVRSVLVPLLGITFVRTVLGWSYRTLMPVYAEEELGFGATGLGILLAAPSVGSLLSSLALASLGNSQIKGKILLGATMLTGLSLVAFSNTRLFALVLFFLVLIGAARNAGMVTNQTLLQVNCEDEFRGRVMAMYMMVLGLIPLGTLPASAAADAVGVPWVLTLQGGILAATFMALWLTKPSIRKLP